MRLKVSGTLGLRRLIFIATDRTELAYFSSPKMNRQHILNSLQLGYILIVSKTMAFLPGIEQAAYLPYFPSVFVYSSWKQGLDKLKDYNDSDTIKLVFHPESDTVGLDNIDWSAYNTFPDTNSE